MPNILIPDNIEPVAAIIGLVINIIITEPKNKVKLPINDDKLLDGTNLIVKTKTQKDWMEYHANKYDSYISPY